MSKKIRSHYNQIEANSSENLHKLPSLTVEGHDTPLAEFVARHTRGQMIEQHRTSYQETDAYNDDLARLQKMTAQDAIDFQKFIDKKISDGKYKLTELKEIKSRKAQAAKLKAQAKLDYEAEQQLKKEGKPTGE